MKNNIFKHQFHPQLLGLLCMMVICWSAKAQRVFELPETDATLITAASHVPSMDAIVFFASSQVFFYPLNTPPPQANEWFSIPDVDGITAVVTYGDDEVLLFDGSSYVSLQPSVGSLLSDWTQWGGLPGHWRNKLTSAVNLDPSNILFVYGTEYVIYDLEQQVYTQEGTTTAWAGWPTNWQNGADALVNIGDGHIYFFNDGEVAPYSLQQQTFYRPMQSFAMSQMTTLSNGQVQEDIADPNPNISSNEIHDICITGSPSGSGYVEQRTAVFGTEEGQSDEDNLPEGSKITEVKVYSGKIWGKTVVAGFQLKYKNAKGAGQTSPVLGKTTSHVGTFQLEDGECIKGISGAVGGRAGNYLNNIQITTTNKTSPLFGSRVAPGAQAFSVELSGDEVFNGFYGSFSQNISSIGLKYFGQPKQSPAKTQVASNTSATTEADAPRRKQYEAQASTMTSDQVMQLGMGIPPTMIDDFGEDQQPSSTINEDGYEVVDAYIDDYDDFTSELGNMAEFMVQPLSGIDWLGAGFDILYYDPLWPNELKNRKSARTVLITNSPARAGNKNQYLKPFGTYFGSANAGAVVDSTSWVTNYQQFTNSFNIGISPSVGIPKVGKGSMSPSFRQMNSTSLGSESIYMFNKVKRKIHEVELQLTWIDNETGQKYKQKLDRAFKKDVLKLPVPSSEVEEVNITEKNQNLPSELALLRGRYYDLIQKYGTHIAQKVAYGGQYISRTQIKRYQYEKARMSEFDFKAAAEVQIKKVTVGNQVNFSMNDGETSKKGNQSFRRDVFVQGGNGEDDLDKWRDKVDRNLAPMEIYFIPIPDILNPKMFADDSDIEKKRKILAIMIQKYVMDNYKEGKNSKGDFFRELPDLPMPGNIMIKNGGGYVMWFTVKYEHEGSWHTKKSGDFSLGFSKSIEIPVGAKSITVTAKQTTGEIFTKTFDKPEIKCYKCWGTIFKTAYGECN